MTANPRTLLTGPDRAVLPGQPATATGKQILPRAAPSISTRALNRATLSRQRLLERQDVSAEAMLRHLIGLQGQVHKAPYIGLWTRLRHFKAADLEDLLTGRRAVRATMMRVTLHVAMAEDFLAIRPLVESAALRGFRTNHLKPLKGLDPEEIRRASRALLDDETLSPAQLGKRLQLRWPEISAIDLSMVARFLEPVVHVPPAGLWAATKAPELTSVKRWLGREPEAMAVSALALRYLAAFGPASGKDFSTWSGVVGGAAVMEGLRPQLVSFIAEDGREVFDLPNATRPDADVAAPPRLLPPYDNVILGYEDRRRMLSAEAFRGLWLGNGLNPAFTVDGFVKGTWKLTEGKGSARIVLSRFEPIAKTDEAGLKREAAALLRRFLPTSTPELVLKDFERP